MTSLPEQRRLRGLALLSLIGACASDPAGGATDSGYVPPQGYEAELCSIVPFDDGGAPSSSAACPATPPSPPAPCQPGTSCQYVRSTGRSVYQIIAYCGPANSYVLRSSVCHPACYPSAVEGAVDVGGAACDTREAHRCPPARPGMTRYDRLTAALEVLAGDCGLPAPGSGATAGFWFDGGCVRQLAVWNHETADTVRDCLVQKLRTLRLDCVADFTCAIVSRTLD
jgi:hypothetical protein